MHISEGVLSAPVLIAGAAATAVFTVAGFRKIKGEMLTKTALMSSLFFVGSFIHVPVGPSSVHLVLNGLIGAVLGLAAFPAVLIALLLQALMFQFGGLTTLGINTLNMALPALFSYFIFKMSSRNSGFIRNAYFFLCGFVPVGLSSVMVALALTLSGKQLMPAASAVLAANTPVMVIEGIADIFIFQFIFKVYPEFLNGGNNASAY
jgi:cobalt/nickel transport system permease protein